jgi:hypothetical protein
MSPLSQIPSGRPLPIPPAEDPEKQNGIEDQDTDNESNDKGKAPEKANGTKKSPREKPSKSLPSIPQKTDQPSTNATQSASTAELPQSTSKALSFAANSSTNLASSSSTLASSSSSTISPARASSSSSVLASSSPKEISLTTLHKEIHAETPKRKKKKVYPNASPYMNISFVLRRTIYYVQIYVQLKEIKINCSLPKFNRK